MQIAIDGAPFGFIVCVCAGVSATRGMELITCSVLGGKSGRGAEEDGLGCSVRVKSLHMIGIEDPQKVRSEEVATMFNGAKVYVL